MQLQKRICRGRKNNLIEVWTQSSDNDTTKKWRLDQQSEPIGGNCNNPEERIIGLPASPASNKGEMHRHNIGYFPHLEKV